MVVFDACVPAWQALVFITEISLVRVGNYSSFDDNRYFSFLAY